MKACRPNFGIPPVQNVMVCHLSKMALLTKSFWGFFKDRKVRNKESKSKKQHSRRPERMQDFDSDSGFVEDPIMQDPYYWYYMQKERFFKRRGALTLT